MSEVNSGVPLSRGGAFGDWGMYALHRWCVWCVVCRVCVCGGVWCLCGVLVWGVCVVRCGVDCGVGCMCVVFVCGVYGVCVLCLCVSVCFL